MFLDVSGRQKGAYQMDPLLFGDVLDAKWLPQGPSHPKPFFFLPQDFTLNVKKRKCASSS